MKIRGILAIIIVTIINSYTPLKADCDDGMAVCRMSDGTEKEVPFSCAFSWGSFSCAANVDEYESDEDAGEKVCASYGEFVRISKPCGEWS